MSPKKEFDKSTSDLIYLSIFLVLICLMGGIFNSAMGKNSNAAQKAVEAQGYADVTALGLDRVSCNTAQKQVAGYAFEATNAQGIRIRLTACKDQSPLQPTGGWYILTK